MITDEKKLLDFAQAIYWELEGGRDRGVLKLLKEFQLDAWKQGMTDAVDIAHNSECERTSNALKCIEEALDSKTTI